MSSKCAEYPISFCVFLLAPDSKIVWRRDWTKSEKEKRGPLLESLRSPLFLTLPVLPLFSNPPTALGVTLLLMTPPHAPGWCYSSGWYKDPRWGVASSEPPPWALEGWWMRDNETPNVGMSDNPASALSGCHFVWLETVERWEETVSLNSPRCIICIRVRREKHKNSFNSVNVILFLSFKWSVYLLS